MKTNNYSSFGVNTLAPWSRGSLSERLERTEAKQPTDSWFLLSNFAHCLRRVTWGKIILYNFISFLNFSTSIRFSNMPFLILKFWSHALNILSCHGNNPRSKHVKTNKEAKSTIWREKSFTSRNVNHLAFQFSLLLRRSIYLMSIYRLRTHLSNWNLVQLPSILPYKLVTYFTQSMNHSTQVTLYVSDLFYQLSL